VRERRKEPREGSETDPETACIQTVGARPLNHSDVLRLCSARRDPEGALPPRLDWRFETPSGRAQRGRQRIDSGRMLESDFYEAYLTERAAREREGKLKRNRRMRNLLMARLKSLE
jgi:hypothetical protein